jgi:hypothetical protein
MSLPAPMSTAGFARIGIWAGRSGVTATNRPTTSSRWDL